ncbi:MAG: FAD-dependent oxidoreductase [Tepidisphaeraceae bacterium]
MAQFRLVLLLVVFTMAPGAPADVPRYYYPVPAADPPQVIEVEVCAYGGSPAGVAAAIQARRMGKSAAIFAFNKHVGGLTSGGLTATDVGNVRGIGGLATEFYDRVGKLRDFKPSAAEATFVEMLKDAGVKVYYEHRLKSVKKSGNRITEIEFENGDRARAGVFVDSTYEGDLLAMAKVSYHVGREANSVYNETLNGIQHRNKHNFNYPTDPYKQEGKPESGLLWGITPDAAGMQGDGDKLVQAYNFRMALTSAPNRVAFPKPEDYDASRYELLLRYLLRKPGVDWRFGYGEGPLQLKAGDSNNEGAFSTDFIGHSHEWPEADYATRQRIFQEHVSYQQGLVWFMANDERLPKAFRDKVNAWGLDPEEFTGTGHWPHQLYIREARRMVSEYVMTEHDCASKTVADDSVGLASYNMDSHNCRRIVVSGLVRNEGDVQVGVPRPYPVSYRAIVPKESECANLLVPVCLSSTHIAYGSIRMEPVFMILGQSAGTAAVMALDAGSAVQKVPYGKLREKLVENRQILDWQEPPKPTTRAK